MECFDGGSPKHNQLGGLLPFFKCAKNTVRYPRAIPFPRAAPRKARAPLARTRATGDAPARTQEVACLFPCCSIPSATITLRTQRIWPHSPPPWRNAPAPFTPRSASIAGLLQRRGQAGSTPKTGASPFIGQFFRQVSDQFTSHFSSTKRAHAGGSFRSCGSHTHAAGSTSFCGESLQ